jgi:hypothetical protein
MELLHHDSPIFITTRNSSKSFVLTSRFSLMPHPWITHCLLIDQILATTLTLKLPPLKLLIWKGYFWRNLLLLSDMPTKSPIPHTSSTLLSKSLTWKPHLVYKKQRLKLKTTPWKSYRMDDYLWWIKKSQPKTLDNNVSKEKAQDALQPKTWTLM